MKKRKVTKFINILLRLILQPIGFQTEIKERKLPLTNDSYNSFVVFPEGYYNKVLRHYATSGLLHYLIHQFVYIPHTEIVHLQNHESQDEIMCGTYKINAYI